MATQTLSERRHRTLQYCRQELCNIDRKDIWKLIIYIFVSKLADHVTGSLPFNLPRSVIKFSDRADHKYQAN